MDHWNSLGGSTVMSSQNLGVALDMAQRSMLLLKNDGGLLPIAQTAAANDSGVFFCRWLVLPVSLQR